MGDQVVGLNMIPAFFIRMCVALLGPTGLLVPETARAEMLAQAGFAFEVVDEFVIIGLVVAAIFLLDKATWSVMTGGKTRR